VRRELNVLALIKGEERYVYLYDDASRDELLAAVRDHAAAPHLSLSWTDAAVLAQRARDQADAAETTSTPSRL
jgi:hypothetical protein